MKKLFKKVRQTYKEYSKQWITRWQYFCMFWISVYLIADICMNHAENAVKIVNSLVVSIVSVMIPYLAKSYFGKKAEEETRLREKKIVLQDISDELEEEE